MKLDVLLAKSCDELNTNESVPSYARLLVHLRLVEDAGKAIFETVGKKVLQQTDLDNEIWNSRLQRALPIACLCHDIGKANEGFQKMVRGSRSPQPLRHELLSALLLIEEGSEIRLWALDKLSDNNKFDDSIELLECVIAAVGGHHLKLDEAWEKASRAIAGNACGQTVRTLLTHENLKPLFHEKVTKEICLDLIKDKANSLQDKYIPFKFSSNRFKENLKRNLDWWRFTAVLKALTTAADVAGSAVSEEANKLENKTSPSKWVKANLAESQFLTKKQMREVVEVRLAGKELRDFQKAVADSSAKVTLVEAGCGTGKTVAAYAWAENHAIGKKLFFCYPTTGTATEGFRGYVAENDVEAELIHSRSKVDFDKVAIVKGDGESKEDEEKDNKLRINSLNAWFPQVVICTADTVLALVRNNRRGLYNSPAILTASFVFDELHAYDNRMFTAVIALIKALPNAHFLLMTASLPKSRKDFLLKHIEDIKSVQTPKKLEELPRYQFEKLATVEEAYDIAERTKNEKLKILWICNTVKRTQAVYEELQKKLLPVQTYHSCFKYEDRKERHRQVIDGFEPKNDMAIIAVTTQVAEMSLDLDADILISEVAPVPSMIQRLGRLNRRINLDNRGKPRTAYFLMLDKDQTKPYEQADIVLGESWIEDLIKLDRPLSQADLADYFQRLPIKDEERLNLKCNWLDSGWFAEPESVREPNVSVSIILPEDKEKCEQSYKAIINKAIPMNYNKQMENWRELKGNLIAAPNTIDYDKERGARWL